MELNTSSIDLTKLQNLNLPIQRTHKLASQFVEQCKDAKQRKKIRKLYDKHRIKDHRVSSLLPMQDWVIFIDETGTIFNQHNAGPEHPNQGRIVGCMAPLDHKLPSYPGFHAVSEPHLRKEVIKNFLNDPRTAVFGLGIDQIHHVPGDTWVNTVSSVAVWMIKMLPLPKGNQCNIKIFVEERAQFKPGHIEFAQRLLIERLSIVDPVRAQHFKVRFEVAPKDGHSLGSYADAIAHAWYQGNKNTTKSIRSLIDHSIFHGESNQMARCWETMNLRHWPSKDDWSWLVNSKNASDSLSPTGIALEQLKDRLINHPEMWERYFNASRDHLESKQIELKNALREVKWLEETRPPHKELHRDMQLLWTISQIELSNHLGKTEEHLERKLEYLSDTLMDENPTIVCLADLHLAVLYTNRLDFQKAEASIDRWKDLPLAIGGLRMRGRVESSRGQHYAFRGDYVNARACFTRAIELFSRHSNPDIQRQEQSQTRSYLVIATLDDPSVSDHEVYLILRDHIGDLLQKIPHFASSDDNELKYKHHTLLRYLVKRGTPEERDLYLSHQESWKVSWGHPWPIIDCYRALLLSEIDPEKAKKILVRAIKATLSPKFGTLIRLMGTTFAAILHGWGTPWNGLDQQMDEIVKNEPNLQPSIDEIKAYLQAPKDPLILLQKTLPFNFH